MTDGLADAMSPAWDASGKYLWFLASTDFGLRSQWLDMSSYDRAETLRALPRGAEEGRAEPAAAGERRGGRRSPAAGPRRGPARSPTPANADAAAPRQPRGDTRPRGAPARPRAPVTVADRLRRPPAAHHRGARASPSATTRSSRPARPARCSFSRPAPRRHRRRRRRGRRQHAAPLPAQRPPRGAVRRRRRGVRRQRRRPQAALSHAAARRRPRTRRGADRGARRTVPGRRRPQPPQAGQGRLNAPLRMYLDPKAEFAQIFNEGWRNQRNYLYVPNVHGSDWPKMKTMYGALLPHVKHRADLNYLLDNMGAEIAVGHSYVRGGDMPDVPQSPRRPARRRLRGRERPLPHRADLRRRELESGAARAARGARRRRRGRRLHPRDQRRRAARARQHLPPARRHGEPADRAHGERAPVAWTARARSPSCRSRTSRGCARARGSRAIAASSTRSRRAARLRLRPEHRAAGLHELQPLLLRAAGQAGRGHRRALQRRRLGGRLHHRRARARLRRLLQQRRVGDRVPFTSPASGHLGAEGDDHQRDGRLGRRPDAVHVPAPQDRPARRQAHVGRPRRTRPTRRRSSTAAR